MQQNKKFSVIKEKKLERYFQSRDNLFFKKLKRCK